jgi:pyrroloquinoline quinone (PQQ) biosynthesis protein C
MGNDDMRIGETLKIEIENYAAGLRDSNQLFRRAQDGDLSPDVLAAYVSNLNILVQHTDKNLTLAQKRATELGRTNLARFFVDKRTEEDGHSRWAENDVRTLKGLFGVAPAEAPASSILGLLEYLRTTIDEEPACYLAYILFAEYVTVLVGPEWLRLLERRCGLPSSAVTVVKNHVELDVSHVADGLEQIDRLVDDVNLMRPMQEALRKSMAYFDQFCSEISNVVH